MPTALHVCSIGIEWQWLDGSHNTAEMHAEISSLEARHEAIHIT